MGAAGEKRDTANDDFWSVVQQSWAQCMNLIWYRGGWLGLATSIAFSAGRYLLRQAFWAGLIDQLDWSYQVKHLDWREGKGIIVSDLRQEVFHQNNIARLINTVIPMAYEEWKLKKMGVWEQICSYELNAAKSGISPHEYQIATTRRSKLRKFIREQVQREAEDSTQNFFLRWFMVKCNHDYSWLQEFVLKGIREDRQYLSIEHLDRERFAPVAENNRVVTDQFGQMCLRKDLLCAQMWSDLAEFQLNRIIRCSQKKGMNMPLTNFKRWLHRGGKATSGVGSEMLLNTTDLALSHSPAWFVVLGCISSPLITGLYWLRDHFFGPANRIAGRVIETTVTGLKATLAAAKRLGEGDLSGFLELIGLHSIRKEARDRGESHHLFNKICKLPNRINNWSAKQLTVSEHLRMVAGKTATKVIFDVLAIGGVYFVYKLLVHYLQQISKSTNQKFSLNAASLETITEC